MIYRLDPPAYHKVSPLFESMDFNLIILAVIAGSAPGEIYVDDAEHPTACFMNSPEGCYLAGNPQHAAFTHALRQHIQDTYLVEDDYLAIDCSPEWESTLDTLFNGWKLKYDRLYYTFTDDHAPPLRDGFSPEVVNESFLQRDSLKNMSAVYGGITSNWHSQADFLQRGFGSCLVTDDRVITWCLADCAHEHRTEIGIRTDIAYRGQGFATLTVLHALSLALAKGYRQIGWHCWAHNMPSRRVAERAGFRFQHHYPSYMCLASEARYQTEAGMAAYRRGEHESALSCYTISLELGIQGEALYWTHFMAALALVKLNHYPQALQSLGLALKHGWRPVEHLIHYEEFTPLHDDPLWQRLLTSS